ncbi:MAG: flagellar basal body rod protein FlgF [Sphingopyxis sp.]
MDRLVHTALSAMRSSMARQTATANNLANVGTTGFRADISVAQALWLRGDTLESRALSSQEVRAADLTPGAVTETGRDLDIALSGDAMLTVAASEGGEAYTRRGDLHLTETGLMTTGDGQTVIGEQGPVSLPPAQSVRIDNDGVVWVVPVGGDPNIPLRVDRLKLVTPAGSDVVKGTDNLFRVRNNGALPADPSARLISRSLEESNVNATEALVQMIDASRAWETQMKLITTAKDLDAASSDLMRMPS